MLFMNQFVDACSSDYIGIPHGVWKVI